MILLMRRYCIVDSVHCAPLGLLWSLFFLATPRGFQDTSVPWPGIQLWPQQWKPRILTIGPPGNSHPVIFSTASASFNVLCLQPPSYSLAGRLPLGSQSLPRGKKELELLRHLYNPVVASYELNIGVPTPPSSFVEILIPKEVGLWGVTRSWGWSPHEWD